MWKLQFSLKKTKTVRRWERYIFLDFLREKVYTFFFWKKADSCMGSKLDYGLVRKAAGLDRKAAGLESKAAGPPESNLRSMPFQDPKKSRFSGPIPSNGPQIGFSRIRIIHYIPRHINNIGTLIVSSFFWSSFSTGLYSHVLKWIGNLFQFEEKPKSSWQYFYLW